ncbi:hypothetical protein PUR49_10525 [Streptomyces sp. BE147]|uniref:hypothetical protein n=1 Tax=Streptomyces sp. BE147 TaxID=3002524 RepID=UPI002E7A1375|nr:hypothetical protein [Streptomyces sp. BE147]MEE1736932.1 hypothetical protein [Streptomyces sp. BE147]
MAGVFGASVSRSTVLRLVEALPDPEPPVPRVVGVDEYATCKGRAYGTLLVDVETRRQVGLLPDREASSQAAWLAKRPGTEVVCRDARRSSRMEATAGALQAVQLADRWLLPHNLSEAAGRCVAQHRDCLGPLAREPVEPAAAAPLPKGDDRITHDKRGTGSPTVFGAGTPPFTPCWRQDTTDARSVASFA